MPFSGPQGQGPFEDHDDCTEAMADEEGVEDADALCAVWERRATGKQSTKMRFDELSRRRLLQAAVDHPRLVTPTQDDTATAAEQRSAATMGVDVPDGPSGVIARQADRDEFDPDDPPEEYRDAIEADDFVIYGKASVEKVDLMGTRFSVDALERALDRFFGSEDAPGIISRGHADVPVGRPIREWTLDSNAVIDLGDDQTYRFEAGDTIRTEAKDADDDDVPELWMVSRLANDSDIARETRYKALLGELDGYSVTVKPKDGATRQTGDSEDILALDLHAVTVGTDDQILNPESKFDVAEFRALFGDTDDGLPVQEPDDADAVAEVLGRRLANLLSQ